MKTAYSFDANTGQYQGIVGAQPNPLEKGKFLLPARATFVAPPELGEDEGAFWDGQAWSVVAPVVEPEPEAPTLEEEKATALLRVTGLFKQARDQGVEIQLGETPLIVASTRDARVELKALVETLEVLGQGATQKAVTRSGAPIEFDLATARSILAVVDAHHSLCNATEYDLVMQINAAQDSAVLEAIDLESPWPKLPGASIQ